MPSRIEKLILKQLAEKPTDYWHLLRASGAHYALFLEGLKNLLSSSFITHHETLYSLTPKGDEVVTKSALDRKSLFTADHFEQLQTIAHNRPQRKDELDQALAPLTVILKRLEIFRKHADLYDTRIILLGDDDCMGAALALTQMPKEVVILEYDEQMCHYYRHYQIPNLTIYQHDLCNPIPEELQNRCDVFFTDPCPSLQLLKVFLSRGLEALSGPGCVGYTAMSQTEASYSKWHVLQKLLIDAGCAITELEQNINTYDLEGEWLFDTGWNVVEKAPFPPKQPDLHWYTSALMRLETIRDPSSLIEGKIDFSPALYKDKEVILTDHEIATYINV